MKKRFFSFLLIALFSVNSIHSQISTSDGRNQLDSAFVNKNTTIVKLNGKTKYTDYKIISFKKDTTYIDTTLTIAKEYKYNFLRKDNFELLAFHNQGQTFNNLAYDFTNQNSFPIIGMNAKHFNYLSKEDINYYKVPTPTSEILYRTGLQQGQVLETLFTLNFSKIGSEFFWHLRPHLNFMNCIPRIKTSASK